MLREQLEELTMPGTRNPASRACLPVFPVLLISLCLTTSAQELLQNPSFEHLEASGIPTAWAREHNPVLSGPMRVVSAAADGQRAVCLLTEEWVLDRPQFITQDVTLPTGAQALRLTAQCKGQGLIKLVIQYRRGGKPLDAEISQTEYGDYETHEETERVFGLTPEYTSVQLVAAVPPDADSARVRIGNTVGQLNARNVWGTAWLDDVSLTASEIPPHATTEPSLPVLDDVPREKGFIDVAKYAHIVAEPPSLNPRALTDGDTETAPLFAGGTERYGAVELRLPIAAVLSHLYVHLRGNAQTVSVRGTREPGGRCTEQLATVTGSLGVEGWIRIDLETGPLSAVRFDLCESDGTFGYRTPTSFISEVRLLMAAADYRSVGRQLQQGAVYSQPERYDADIPTVSLKPCDAPRPRRPAAGAFRKMMCADLWMWGAGAAIKKDAKPIDFGQSEAFHRTVDFCKRMGVDTVYVDLHVSCGRNILPWPSKVANGTDENVFADLIEALHGEGFTVYVELLSNLSPPFERHYWHYPKEECSRYPRMQQYPSIVFGEHYRDNWLALLTEIMACGADGVGICTDEHYYKGHFMETFPADEPARRLYRERFGHDLPGHEEDSLAFRQWVSMRHKGLGDLYGYWSRELRKAYPSIYIGGNFMVFYAGNSYLTETCLPIDVLGARGGIDELGSDYMTPYGIRALAAANGWRRASMWFSGDWGPNVGRPTKPDVKFYAEALWSAMYGLGSLSFWRYNYVVDNGHMPTVSRAYGMLRDLEALGAWEARPPKRIALLTSRASKDWWQIRAWWGEHDDPNWDRGIEGIRGWFAERAVFAILQENGYSFDWFFLDRDDQLDALEAYDVLLLPFAWSVSDAAAERVRSAAASGTAVLLFDGKKGATDEWGESREAPAFDELCRNGQAVCLEEDILRWGATDRYAEKILQLLDKHVDPAYPLTLKRYGQHIDAALLQRKPGERFVFLLNWEKKMTGIDLGLRLPAGKYEAYARDENRWFRVGLGDAQVLDAAAVGQFRLWLPPEKPCVLYVRGTD